MDVLRTQPLLAIAPGFDARPAVVADAAALAALIARNRERLARHLPAVAGIDTEAAAAAHLLAVEQQRSEGRLLEWHLFADGGLVGAVRLNHIAPEHASLSIAYYIDAGSAGRGLATAAVRRVLRHGFDVLGVYRVELRCAVDNEASARLAERMGFVREGRLRGAEQLAHGRVDHYVYGLLRDDPAALTLVRAPLRIIETERLRLRPLALDDAAFILELVNDPDWLHYIGDRGVHTLADAHRYIGDGPLAMYARYGCGLLLVETLDGGVPVGLCGLLRRDTLPDPDIGYALLPAHRGRGYAREAAEAVLADGRERLRLRRILATTKPFNARSGALLELLGLRFERMLQMAGDDAPVKLYAWDADAGVAEPVR